MSEERQELPPSEAQVKVVDRRRFRADGEPVEEGGPVEEASAGASEPAGAAAGEVAGEGQPAAAPDPDEELRALAQTQKARIDELTRAYASLVEDNKAFRQRMEREKARVLEAERAALSQVLLEAADDLERAMAAVSGADLEQGNVRNLVEGVRLSLATLHKRIAELGAERIAVAGLPFDPQVAEAVDVVAVADAEQDGLVVQEVRAGYRIGDRVLRPARVRVGRLARA